MKYEKYKDSGVEWLGEVPEHWEVKRLKASCSLFGRIGFRGYTVSDLVDEDEGAITISPTNMDDIELDFSKCSYLSWDKYYESPEIMVEVGDVLLVKTASVGKCSYVSYLPKETTINPQILVLKKHKDYSKFIAYLFQTSLGKAYIETTKVGSTIATISQDKIGNYTFAFPPLPEQQAIANYLDAKCAKINGSIDVQKRKIELLNELKQTIITDAVTKGLNPNAPMKNSGVEWIGEVPEHWEVMRLKRCALIKTGCTPPTGESKYYDSEDIDWFTPADIVGSEIREAEKKISFVAQKEGVCRIFPKNSIYFVGIGSIGKVSYCEISASSNQQINVITPNKRANYKYLTYVLKSQKDEIALTANSVTLPIINQDRTGSLLCPIPPIEEQQIIVAHIESETSKIDAQIAKANRRIELLNELKQSIITEAVTGKIKVC